MVHPPLSSGRQSNILVNPAEAGPATIGMALAAAMKGAAERPRRLPATEVQPSDIKTSLKHPEVEQAISEPAITFARRRLHPCNDCWGELRRARDRAKNWHGAPARRSRRAGSKVPRPKRLCSGTEAAHTKELAEDANRVVRAITRSTVVKCLPLCSASEGVLEILPVRCRIEVHRHLLLLTLCKIEDK